MQRIIIRAHDVIRRTLIPAALALALLPAAACSDADPLGPGPAPTEPPAPGQGGGGPGAPPPAPAPGTPAPLPPAPTPAPAPVPAYVVVRPGGSGLYPGQTVQLVARGVSASGDTILAESSWTSENPAVATVDATGRVTALQPGSAVIRATLNGVDGRGIVFVHGATIRPAVTLGNAPLPAAAYNRLIRDQDGTFVEQQVVVAGGFLRLEDGGYHMALDLEIYQAGTRVGTERWEDLGKVLYNMMTGDPMLESVSVPGVRHPGTWIYANGFATGEVRVDVRLGEVLLAAVGFGRG